ncbi:ABC transporter substrate-binding protein [Mesorhizobium sp. CCNWLW179-1]|uniref:ABC transporter substrate-binding protein n=1 Tax=unclassified Mesorhizobium TaxID=325217 RepID=UPI003014DB05
MRGNLNRRVFTALSLAMMTTGSVSPAISQDLEPLKIGAIYATSGSANFLGVPEERGLRLLVDQLNEAGGIKGRRIELTVYDTEGNGTKAAQQFRRLVGSDEVDIVFGPSSSGESLLVLPIANEEEVPIIMHAGTEKVFTPPTPWAFNTPPSDRIVAADLLSKFKTKGITKIAVFSSADGFGQSGANVVNQIAPGEGITVVSHEEFNRQDTDMTPQLLRIKEGGAEALVIWGALPGPSIILKNATTIGFDMPIYNSYAAATDELLTQAGPAAEGTFVTSMRLLAPDTLSEDDPIRPVVQKLYEDFKAKWGVTPATYAAHSYDAMLITKVAVESIEGEITRQSLRDAIEKVSVKGGNGIYSFSPENHGGLNKNSLSMVLLVAKDGKWVLAD